MFPLPQAGQARPPPPPQQRDEGWRPRPDHGGVLGPLSIHRRWKMQLIVHPRWRVRLIAVLLSLYLIEDVYY